MTRFRANVKRAGIFETAFIERAARQAGSPCALALGALALSGESRTISTEGNV
jgi:hypothetical protein